jgi:hypothetical protein
MRLIGLIPAIYLASIPPTISAILLANTNYFAPNKREGWLSVRGGEIFGRCYVLLVLLCGQGRTLAPKVIFGAENNF